MSFSQEFTFKRFRLYGLLDWHRGADVINTSNFVFDFGGTLADTTASKKRLSALVGRERLSVHGAGELHQAARGDAQLHGAAIA